MASPQEPDMKSRVILYFERVERKVDIISGVMSSSDASSTDKEFVACKNDRTRFGRVTRRRTS